MLPACYRLLISSFKVSLSKSYIKSAETSLPISSSSSPTFAGKIKKVKKYKGRRFPPLLLLLFKYFSLSLACTKMPATGTDSGVEKINVSVRGQDDRVLYFRINSRAKLMKIFNIYCERRQLDVRTVQFLFEGNRITGNRTPHSLRIEDGAEICAFIHQFGGGRQ